MNPRVRFGTYGACCICILFASFDVCAQQQGELEIPSSPSPVGSGARAAGMASAFVAIADDATAASWNPAGLVQLERPELSLVLGYNRLQEDFHTAASERSFESSQISDESDINFLSFLQPIPGLIGERNAAISISFQQKFSFEREFAATRVRPVSLGHRVDRWNFSQGGDLKTLTVTGALELTKTLSVGASINLWRDWLGIENGWEREFTTETSQVMDGVAIPIGGTRDREEFSDFEAESHSLGILWNFHPQWQFGARYETPFTATLKRTAISSSTQDTAPSVPQTSRITMHFPDTLAVGLAYRPNDRWTIALDLSRTDWHDFFLQDENGVRFSLLDGLPLNGDVSVDPDPTYTVRLGFEYLFLPRRPRETLKRLWSIRGGVQYDQEPATGTALAELEGIEPDTSPDDFYVLAVGAGIQLNQRINLDFAYQLRYGSNVNREFLPRIEGFSEDVLQHRVLISTVIYF